MMASSVGFPVDVPGPWFYGARALHCFFVAVSRAMTTAKQQIAGVSVVASFNRVILMGNLTRDVRLEKTPQGTSVAEVGLAVKDRVKRNGEWVDEVTFVDIVLWGRTAEIAGEYLSKGSPAFFEGRLKLETWENKEGQKRSKMRVIADRLQLLGTRSGNGAGGTPSGVPTTGPAIAAVHGGQDHDIPEEDIPF